MQSLKKRFFDTHKDYYLSGFKFPYARVNEFKNFKKITINLKLKNILEFPSDGKMLNYVYPESIIDRGEVLHGDWENLYRNKIFITSYGLSDIKDHHYDAILGITPFHHATHKQQIRLIDSSIDKIKNRGILIFGEVLNGSKEAIFLDEFIHKFSKNGHKGNYPDIKFIEILKNAGYSKTLVRKYSCPWIFQTEKEMCIFCKKIFGLNKIKTDFLLSNLMAYLGYKKYRNQIYLNWNLIYFVGLKR